MKVSVVARDCSIERLKDVLEGLEYELILAEGPEGIVEGMRRASGDVVMVLSGCDPSLIPMLLEGVKDHELVVASRRGLRAKIVSALAALLLGVKVGDPSSGCFAFKKRAVRFGDGGSPLLGLLYRSKGVSILEIPCEEEGHGFLKPALQTLRLSGYRPLKFALVGLLGIIINEGLLYFLVQFGMILAQAGLVSIECSILSNFFLNDIWTFRGRGERSVPFRCVKYHGAVVVGAVINYGVLLLLATLGIGYLLANLIGIALGFVVNYLLSELIVWK